MSTIKVDTIATRTGSGNITASNTIAGTSATLSGTLGVTGATTTANITTGNTSIITAGRFISSQTSNDPWFKGVNSSNNETLFIKKDGQIYSAFGLSVGGTGAANTLDDYEEGTWTPVFYSGGVVGGTYASQYGTYTKIGRQVFVNFGIQNNSMSGSTLLRLGGLPFSMSSAVNGGGASSVLAQGFDSVGLESYQGSDNQVFYDIKNGGYLTHGGGQSKKIQGNFTYIA